MANNTSIGDVVGKKNLEELNRLKAELKEVNELLQAQTKILADVNKQYAGAKNTTQLKAALNKQEQANLKIQQEQNKILIGNKKLEQEAVKVKSLHLKKIQEIKKARQEQLKVQKLNRDAQLKEVKETERLANNKKKEALATEKATKAAKEQSRAYVKLNADHIKAVKLAKDLAVQYGVDSKQAIKAAKAANVLGKNLKKIDASVGQRQRNVGGYFKDIAKSAIAAGIAFVGFRTVFNVFKNSLKTIANFEEAMSKVKAVTGALPKEFKQLSDNAKMLGSSTSKTATEVAGLQLEFSKLGFSTQEILNATEATISLSIAAGSDLAESAVVAASTIRGFGLDASEAQRVVDVMAKSFASSALDLEKFKTSMAAVAPVAKANGKDIEFVTSQLSVLSDAGLDASTSGTSLRNMFLNLSKEGLTWEQGLAKINNSTNKNVAALDLFGKRGATAALILADNIKKAEGLEKAYDGAAGAAEEMARIMEDNLIGDTKKLSSAWEGFILSLNSGEGTLSRVLRGAVNILKEIVGHMEYLNTSVAELEKRYNSAFVTNEIEQFEKKLKDVTDETERLKIKEDELEYNRRLVNLLRKDRDKADEARDKDKQESLTRLINNLLEYRQALSELNVINKESAELTEEDTDSVRKQESALTKLIPKVSELNDAWKKVIETFGVEFAESIKDNALKSVEEISGESITILKERNNQELADFIEKEAEKTRISQEETEKRKEIAFAYTDKIAGLADTLFDYNQGIKERELESVRANYDARINAAEGNSELQEALTKELAQKQWAIELELAKSEKNQAIISATIATAVATVEALPNIALAALTAAAGVIQIATIQAQPLPEPPAFAKGTKSTPDTFIAGDKPNNNSGNSQELMITKDGKMLLTPNHATLYENMSGTQVIPADQTKQILNTVNMANAGVISTRQMEGKLDEIKEAVVQSESKLSLDKRGIVTLQRGNNAMVTKLNTRI